MTGIIAENGPGSLVTPTMLQSRNYPPAPDLDPYIRRHYIFAAELPAEHVIVDRLLSETAFVRILLKGDWAAEIAPGWWENAGPIALFGGNSLPQPVRVRGPFLVAGFAIKPSGWAALFDETACTFTNRMYRLRDIWGAVADEMFENVAPAADDAAMIAAMEDALRRRIAAMRRPGEDRQIARFEAIARLDSTTRVEIAATELGLSVRQLERRCLKGFGLTPKMILRRSRFLDMATAMRGFSDPSEEELAALSYFDQSHLNREFRRFTGMTPGAFMQTQTPLLNAGLKLRAEGGRLFSPD